MGPPRPSSSLRRDRVLVGDFGGYGGQLNQHVYAKISGPPPALSTMEAKVVALRPQLVRIFFNTSEWTNEDRMASFVRTVELAERADAEINITWQGSTFEFAMRNMPRFADELSEPRAAPRHRAPLGDDVQRAEHDRTDTRRVRAGVPLAAPSARGARRARSHPVHGRGPHAFRAGRFTGRMAAVHGEPHGRSAGCVVGARLLGLLGHRQDRSAAPRRSAEHRGLDPTPSSTARSTSPSSASAGSGRSRAR